MRRMTRVGAGVLLALPLLAIPTNAQAATIVLPNPGLGEMIVKAEPGHDNDITITHVSGNLIVRDRNDTVPAQPGSGCTALPLDPNAVKCPSQGIFAVRVFAGDGNDRVEFNAIDDGEVMTGFLHGEAGDDVLILGPKAGGGELFGGPGKDRLGGGRGNDRLDGGEGPDLFSGGDGDDEVSYRDRRTPVVADIDNADDDGAVGERDNILIDVEQIAGGAAGNRLVGSAGRNRLVGGAGRDTLVGLGGDDGLRGEGGDDLLFGNEGSDFLAGGDGADFMDGGPGPNRVTGDTDSDSFEGDDGVFEKGVDTVSYGGRRDGVTVINNGQPISGATGERDDVEPTVENIHGGEGPDKLVVEGAASAAAVNTLLGNAGDDRLDTADGGSLGDRIDGGVGDNTCRIDSVDVTVNCR